MSWVQDSLSARFFTNSVFTQLAGNGYLDLFRPQKADSGEEVMLHLRKLTAGRR